MQSVNLSASTQQSVRGWNKRTLQRFGEFERRKCTSVTLPGDEWHSNVTPYRRLIPHGSCDLCSASLSRAFGTILPGESTAPLTVHRFASCDRFRSVALAVEGIDRPRSGFWGDYAAIEKGHSL